MSAAGAECVNAPTPDGVDPRLGERGDVLELDPSGYFDERAASGDAHGLLEALWVEVVEHHDVRAGIECFAQRLERLHLHFDLRRVGSARLGPLDGNGDAAGGRDVVVLDEDCGPETIAMVVRAADAHGVSLECAEARRGLPRVGDARATARRKRFDVSAGAARDTAHPLDEVQRGSLRHEDRAGRAGDGPQDVSANRLGAVGAHALHDESRVDARKYRRKNVTAADDELGARHCATDGACVVRDRCLRGRVTAAEIFVERAIDEALEEALGDHAVP